MKKISPERLQLLNTGQIESRNLMEFLALDPELILKNNFPEFNYIKPVSRIGIVQKLEHIAANLNDQFGFQKFEQLSSHKSDLIRSLACYLLAKQPFSFEDKLELMTRLAEDQNSGVREWAWLAIRKEFAQDLIKNISYLVHFTDQSPNLRRFVCELSRPRGVWCRHILEFRESPWLGLEIIEPLKSDEAKYVQLSVGNWLNDASKTQSNWVKELCFKWQQESSTKHTHAICKRALRTIHKEENIRSL
jgi:3-methyladenine DNA glycosylase AlkC